MARVLFIHHSGLIGGAGVSLYNNVKTVAKSNEVYVALSDDPRDMLELLSPLEKELGVKLIPYGRRIGAITYYSGGDAFLSPRFIYRSALIKKQKKYWERLIEETDPDVIAVNSKTTAWLGGLSSVKKRNSICFVRETVKGNRDNFINRRITKQLDRFSKVIFLSEYDRKTEKLKNADTEVIHNYVSDGQFNTSLSKKEALEKLGITGEGFIVLYAGGVSEIKGFDIAVQAVLTCDKSVKLIVAGSDFAQAAGSKDKKTRQYVQRWKEYVSSNDKDGQIVFVGKQSDMSACYACADTVIFPMREPHQARPAFEAGYFKKPIIITDFENIKEFVRDGYNGLLAPNESVGDFARAIERLRTDAELLEKLGNNNYRNTVENHNREISCKRINAIIEEYAGK